MATSVRGAELRGDLATFRERARKGPYPGEMRQRAVAYVAKRVRDGAEASEIATELGVREVTASRWMQEAGVESTTTAAARGQTLSLIPLVIGGQQVRESRPRLRVDCPDGTRVHAWGLSVADVVETIRALRRGR